jgi:hypothetical protein
MVILRPTDNRRMQVNPREIPERPPLLRRWGPVGRDELDPPRRKDGQYQLCRLDRRGRRAHTFPIYPDGPLFRREDELDYKARLVWTPCNFGGRRWWFVCPLVVNGRACNRRVGVLYLGGGKYFGCRPCHDLTYESSRESHKFDRMFLRMGIDPKEGKRLFKKGF